MVRRHFGKLVIVAVLVALGLAGEVFGLLDAEKWIGLARQYAQHWWLVLLIILIQSILFTFALAGSLFLWVAALLYPPVTATLILVTGSTLGGLGAYFLSGYLTDEVKNKIEISRVYKMMHAGNDFFTLFALRVFPGFPHSVVNYSAGILRADLGHFILAAVLGISIKTYLYARVIYSAASGVSVELLLDASVVGPLLVLSLLGLVGMFLNYRHARKKA